MIIGITGTKRSGKSVLAKALEKKGFVYSSLSDRVREEAAKRGLQTYTIRDLQDIGNELRTRDGTGILAKRTLDVVAGKENVVVEGIRNPGEVEVLRNAGQDFYLIAVDAPQRTRFQRMVEAAKPEDPADWEGFLEMDARDMGGGEVDSGQQVAKCMEKADYLFWKDYSTPKDAEAEFLSGKKGFLNLFERFGEKKRRPSFDEVYMHEASTWSSRTTCLRRKTGAVITLRNAGVSQGYNGSPRGMENCNEIGECLRIREGIPSGQRLEMCNAVHAEANALLNALSSGSPVEGGTLYSTTYPCSLCAGLIINARIARIVYDNQYTDPNGIRILEKAEARGVIKVQRFEGVKPKSFDRFFDTV
jgi:dCMP deaminase